MFVATLDWSQRPALVADGRVGSEGLLVDGETANIATSPLAEVADQRVRGTTREGSAERLAVKRLTSAVRTPPTACSAGTSLTLLRLGFSQPARARLVVSFAGLNPLKNFS